jgi:hypothetical protein
MRVRVVYAHCKGVFVVLVLHKAITALFMNEIAPSLQTSEVGSVGFNYVCGGYWENLGISRKLETDPQKGGIGDFP